MREALVTITDDAFADLGIEELVSLGQTAGVRDVEELTCRGDGSVIQLEVETRLDEERLDALSYVEEWERLSAADDGHLYVVAFSVPALSSRMADRTAELVGTCDPDLDDGGATVSLVGSQGAISDTLGEYQREGVSPDLRSLGSYDGRDHPLDGLTDRQREVVRTAYELGYYEVPRAVSTADVSDELDLDPSTVSEHLQRAERNLLSRLLSSD